MADPLNPFRGGQLRLFTAATSGTLNSAVLWPSRRKDEDGRSMIVDTSLGTFTFQIQAKVDAGAPWVNIPMELPDGVIQDTLSHLDLNAADQVTVKHDVWPRMRHRITSGVGHSIDSWIVV